MFKLIFSSLLLILASISVSAEDDQNSKTLVSKKIVARDPFVAVKNGSFYKGCSKYYLVSMNYWGAMNLAADESSGGNQTRFKTEVKQLADHGVNNVRIMAASEGSNNGVQPFRMYPALQPTIGNYDEKIFVGLDRALVEFSKYNITVVMTLNNFWHWSGGYSQYVSWATNDSTIPYPSSWDPDLNPPFGDYTNNGSWGSYNPSTQTYDGFTGFAGRFYNDTSITNRTQTWFKDHIKRVINRVNTVTGIAYKDDPTIMTWELTNEPQDPPLNWIVDTAQYIKSLAPKQLVTVGFEGKNGEWWFKRVHAPNSIDYTCGHLWVQNWGFYDPLDPTDGNLTVAESYADQYLANLSSWAVDLNKPVVLEEFGMARDNFQNVEKGAPRSFYLYDASATTTHKDRYFSRIINKVVEYFKQGKGFQGTGPWSYGGIWRPTDRRNSFGQSWAGDPPHEAPGWYDLYDTDPTMKIVSKQAEDVNNKSTCTHKRTRSVFIKKKS
ncbi:glycoside hydrolase superfamily [Phakopsora pachyrhizi]|nr:glycoside hydrolase superfamily [Phakopsora pachyrhizi]